MRSRSSTRPDALHEIGKLVNKLLDDDGDTQAEQELAYVLGKAIWPAHDRTFRRAEQLGLPCYLEASNERSVPFYKRHGFKVVETYYHFEGGVDGDGNRIVGRGPVVTLMFRPLGGVAH